MCGGRGEGGGGTGEMAEAHNAHGERSARLQEPLQLGAKLSPDELRLWCESVAVHMSARVSV